MPRLNWGERLYFANDKEYYETLGFLCKEEEAVRVYTEDNKKAGARGMEGRLRVNKVNGGNYNFFPEPLKRLFLTSRDGRPSVTAYVCNLRDDHCFTVEYDPTGKDFTKWLSKSSLDDVQETVPEQYHRDFMRGYQWNYQIDTRVLSKEYLADNARKKNISAENDSKNRIAGRNREIAMSRGAGSEANKYDVFLSHSSLDKTLILSLVDLFVDAGYAVYVDWIEDTELDRSHVTQQTAETLKKRMNASQGLAYVSTVNISSSKWCPWELGYFDGKKSNRCCILPIMEAGEFKGQEYLGLYPYLRYDQEGDSPDKEFLVYDQKSNRHITLRDWLNGKKI
ncbi:MAG: toll/interleukin-1 receptor domain-containing protein [Blautia sp.]|nr:toll/interleukin-1 receptor domain-containing protein [Blautia sp.]